ncbi:MAG: B-box zinc finger protein [Anaerolineales bacterium]|nr:B-box zinc finger protein [Anaerolineales bacterium]
MTDEPGTVFCANHPNTPTSLRCNRCEKPICPKCAVLTPTGYRCKECLRGQQKVYETALVQDYIFGATTAGLLSFLGSLILPRLGWFLIFVAPIAGVIIAEAARFVIRRRRARRLFLVITAAAALGSLLLLVFQLAASIMAFSQYGVSAGGSLLSLIWYGLYSVVVTSTVYYRLTGINIR